MNAQDLRIVLEQTNDKLSIFGSKEIYSKYEFTVKEFFDLISEFLTDEEILKLFDYPHFRNFDARIRSKIISLVSSDKIMLQMLSDEEIMKDMADYQVVDIIKKMSNNAKKQLLHNQVFIEKYQIPDYELRNIVASLPPEEKAELLLDSNLMTNILNLADFQIVELVKELPSEELKDRIIETYQFKEYHRAEILKTYNSKHKIEALLESEDINSFYIIDILKTLDTESLSEFFREHRDFCDKAGIQPYDIIHRLEAKQQKDFIENLENAGLTLEEKREILAILKPEVKESIDRDNLPDEYKAPLTMQTISEYTVKIAVDLDRSLEDYRGLDNLISINPEEFTEEQKTAFMKLCDICPNLEVISNLNKDVAYFSTASEYREAEEWISHVISSLNPEYSKAQKMAVIDNAIGKRISYSPDFDTEVFNRANCRALWKIISSGYGVCNGIAKVEQYMLSKVGIESELISSGTHAFLKIKDIELPLANGETVRGNTIVDPTWNLTTHRFGGRPNNFCISYEQARKNDVDSEGKDHETHKNDEQLQDATVYLDEQSLRQLFKSVGLAERDGQFPIKDMLEQSKQIDETYANQPEKNISEQFSLLRQKNPEFAICQNSSMSILRGILLNNENLQFNKCAVNRVYDRTDEQKRPIMFVYIDSDELGQRFYFADKGQGKFVEMPKEEFTKQFECYDTDLEKHDRN